MNYGAAFDLLAIDQSGRGSPGRGGRRSGYRYNPLTSWANKDMEGNSSIASRNRSIYNQQVEDKVREAYERDRRKENGKDWQSDWSLMSKDDKNFLKDKYAPQLSSNERNTRDRSRENERKEDAREAVRDYVAEQKAAGKDYDGDNRWTHADAEAARKEAKEKQKQKEGDDDDDKETKKDDESEADTKDKAAELEGDLNGDGFLSPAERLTLIESKLSTHMATPYAHGDPYGV